LKGSGGAPSSISGSNNRDQVSPTQRPEENSTPGKEHEDTRAKQKGKAKVLMADDVASSSVAEQNKHGKRPRGEPAAMPLAKKTKPAFDLNELPGPEEG
jgi:hypothetical protein